MVDALPPLNAVRAFVSAARHQSFTLAANELHVTHGAISRQVKSLEAHLGVALFERRTRQISLTVEGLRFYTHADAALRQIAAAAQAAMTQGGGRVVRINVRPSFAVRWLIPRLPDFVARHPGIEPHVLTSTRPPGEATDRFDIAIRRGHADWPPSARLHPFLEDHICLVASPALLDAHAVAEPAALASLVLLDARTRKDDWQAWATHAGLRSVKPAGHMMFDHVHLVLQAAIDGLGFAVATMSLAGSGLASGQLRSPFPDLRVPVGRYYYGIESDAVTEVQAFAAWLDGELARQGANTA